MWINWVVGHRAQVLSSDCWLYKYLFSICLNPHFKIVTMMSKFLLNLWRLRDNLKSFFKYTLAILYYCIRTTKLSTELHCTLLKKSMRSLPTANYHRNCTFLLLFVVVVFNLIAFQHLSLVRFSLSNCPHVGQCCSLHKDK